ncbi:uncharacterized protein LOC131888528 [Tigriopus californicus]|uniref:uncharacterized protein LOC131888528 n=1 Tax=Tigriopus californicus TaxID=6832 RepID=UPI0027DA5310|nr:uncharacterized protein LOC131888528 [Tigriopus californicus]
MFLPTSLARLLYMCLFWFNTSWYVIGSEFPERPNYDATPNGTSLVGQSQRELWADQGQNVTLDCTDTDGVPHSSVAWSYHNAAFAGPDYSPPTLLFAPLPSHLPPVRQHLQPLPNGSLALFDLSDTDGRVYTCQDMESNESLNSVQLHVRTIPPAVTNLSVMAHSVYALVTWVVPGDGGASLRGFRLRYRRDKSHLSEEDELALAIDERRSYEWTDVPLIGPHETAHTVYGLAPNSTYFFRICAENRLGCGSNVSVMVDTTYVESEVDAAKELMAEEVHEQSYFKSTFKPLKKKPWSWCRTSHSIPLLILTCWSSSKPKVRLPRQSWLKVKLGPIRTAAHF